MANSNQKKRNLQPEFLVSELATSIINTTTDAIITTTLDGEIVFWNKGATALYGYTSEEVLGENIDIIYQDEDVAALRERIKKVIEGEDLINIDLTAIDKNKNQLRILLSLSGVKDECGKTKHLFGITKDITEIKHTEQKLQETESLFSSAISAIDEGFIVQDLQDKILSANQAAADILGLTMNQLLGKDSYDSRWKALHEDGTLFNFEDFPSIITSRTGKPVSDVTMSIDVGDNKRKWILINSRPVFNKNKKQTSTVITFLDITEQKNADHELKKAFSEISDLKLKLEAENIYLKEELKLEGSFEEIIGSSKTLKKALKQIEQVAKSDTTVLILGETGTGKELIAKALHTASDRNNKPLVKVNCSALPSELIESELFGHEKGAFTGAINRKIGRFELAHKGTIFLDEIGDLPIDLQTRLLRVLQESEFERLGGEKTIKVDIRVITATNRNLEELVVDGTFRQDLYYRLNVFPITSPPLRDRKDDIPALANHFINKYNRKLNGRIKTVNQDVINRFMNYKWPGNIRELEHVIERAVILNVGEQLRLGSWFNINLGSKLPENLGTFSDMERNHIRKVLNETNWKIRGKHGAAEILDLKPTTLESRMKKLNIHREK